MIRRLLTMLAVCSIAVGTSTAVSAQVFDPICSTQPDAAVCTEKEGNRIFGEDGIITTAATILSLVTGIASVILIVVAGIQFATAGGDSTGVANARNTVIYALIGLIVTALAQVIVQFVLTRIG